MKRFCDVHQNIPRYSRRTSIVTSCMLLLAGTLPVNPFSIIDNAELAILVFGSHSNIEFPLFFHNFHDILINWLLDSQHQDLLDVLF